MKTKTLALINLIAVTGCFAQTPIASYNFSGNANDLSGNEHNGIVNGATLTTDRFGNENSAYRFDGIDDYIEIADDNMLDINASKTFTMWFYKNASTSIQHLLSKGRDVNISYFYGMNSADSIHNFSFRKDGINYSLTSSYSEVVQDSTWHLYTGVYDNVLDSMFLYIDGIKLDAESVLTGIDLSNGYPLVLGRHFVNPDGSGGFGYPFNGKLDDLRIYNDALTDCEIWSLYLEGITGLNQTETVDICEGDNHTFPDGSVQSNIVSNTVYVSSFPSTQTGCDSAFVETMVNVNPLPDVTVNQSETTLTAQNISEGITYQWLDCDNGFALIDNETNQAYTAVSNGNYALEITENSCVDTSACHNISTLGVIENGFGNELIVYPNPTDGNFSIKLGEKYKSVKITITDLSGKTTQTMKYSEIQLLNLKLEEPAGLYLLIIEADDNRGVIQLLIE